MSEVLIRRAFETRLGTFAEAQGLPVSWENVALNPQPTGPYLRCFLLPARATSRTLDRLHRMFTGIFQVDVCMPTNTGPAAADAVITGLESIYLPQVQFVESGLRIVVVEPISRGPAIPVADRFIVPCSIQYRADL